MHKHACERAIPAGVLTALLIALIAAAPASGQTVRSPEDFAGHRMGADYKIVRWDKIVEYFREVGDASDRVNVRDMGTTLEGRPFILAEISSPDAIAGRERHMEDQRKISDPRLIADADEERRLVETAKVVVFINCNLHSTEIASSQMALELLHDLATGDSPEILEILDKTIIILVPSANPDGMEKVADWYYRSFETPWEGSGMPWLYHTYAGHDNNRDWFMLNLKETRLETRVLYHEWRPNVVYDIHQMGSASIRYFVPPFFDPKNPNIHPLNDDMMLIIGGHMALELTRNGKSGVAHSAMYDNWWQGGFRTTVYRHNMVGLLTEAASVRVASPIFLRKSELRGVRRGLPDYTMTTNFPDPWPGGWWRFRDIVEYEKISCMSLFTLAARYRALFVSNSINQAREAVERGKTEPPFAWLVPPGQHDPGTAADMLQRLQATGIEIHRAVSGFTADGVSYPPGTYIMYCAQPYRMHLKDMMERQDYPDREQYPGGPPEVPYDNAGWTLPLQMGVRSVAVNRPFTCDAVIVEEVEKPQGGLRGSGSGYLVRAGANDVYRLLNRLGGADIPAAVVMSSTGSGGRAVPAGSLYLPDRAAVRKAMPGLLEGLSIDLEGSGRPAGTVVDAPSPRLALYQPWTANTDEGWTRFVLDSFEYDYTSLHNAEIRAGGLYGRYDCIVLPSAGPGSIINGRSPDSTEPRYVGGIEDDGIVALQDFVKDGGTLVCIDASCNLPIDHFNIPVKNIVRGKKLEEFFCAGSILRIWVDSSHPVGYGMPEWASGYFTRSQAFEIVKEKKDDTGAAYEKDRHPADRYPATVVARYSDTVLLESGFLNNGALIADKPAVVEVKYGDGRIVLLGFRVQNRGQPHGTFKLLFNAIQRSTLSE